MADLTYLDHDGLCQHRRSRGALPCTCSPVCRCTACKRARYGEPCPDCAVPMTVESGLWYCDQCDAYHGEADTE